MRTKITALIIATGILLWCALPVMAFTEPGQGTDNATDVVVWYGDNQTIVVEDLEAGIDSGAAVIADAHTATGNQFLTLAIVALIVASAFAVRSLFLYIICCPVAVIYGLTTASDATAGSSLWAAGIVITIFGLYCLTKPIEAAWQSWESRKGGSVE